MVRWMTLAAALGLMSTMGVAAGNPPTQRMHRVTIEDMRFLPETLTIAAGDTVVWVNKDLVPHTATSTDGAFDSEVIQVNKSWRFTIRDVGEFAYTCTFHPTMKAMVRVE